MLKLSCFHIACIVIFWGLQINVLADSSGKRVYYEDFKRTRSGLKAEGWILAGNSKPVVVGGKNCLEVVNRKAKKVLPYIFLEVEPGKRYTVTCLIKTENVSSKSRGATIFLEWCDKDKKFTPGGKYPSGFKGNSPWTTFKIDSTNTVPETVKYMKLYTAMEGTGKAWFRDITVTEYDNWTKVKLQIPADKALLNHCRPIFSWEKISGEWRLSLATNKNFSRDKRVFSVGNSNTFLVPEFLDKEKTWYWQVQGNSSGTDCIYRSDIHSFKISSAASAWPVIIKDEYQWSDMPKPVLDVRIAGDHNLKINIDIDDIPAEIISFRDGLLKFKPCRELAQGIHKIKFTCKNNYNEQFSVSNIYSNIKPASKVSWKQGIIYTDSKPFFPVGAYCDLSYDYLDMEFRGLKEAGFNLVHSYIFEGSKGTADKAAQYLNAAEKHKLKVFMGIHRDWIRDRNNANMTRYISEVMKSPALLTWYLFDEPVIQKVTVAQLKNVYQLVKSIDPFRPAFVAFTSVEISQSAREYAECCDIIGSDPYPLMLSKPLTLVEEWTRKCRVLVGKDRPVWTIIEAFDHKYSKLGKYKKSYGPVTTPAYQQMRCECFLALSAGADGILFFWMPMRYYNLEKDAPSVWNGVVKIVKELRTLDSFMTAPRRHTKFSINMPKPFRIWIRSNTSGETAIAFINPLEKTQYLKISLPLDNKKMYAEDKIIQLKNNIYESSFKPYETKVYIIK